MRPARFERATPGFVDRYSIQLNYGRSVLTEYMLLKTGATQWGSQSKHTSKRGDCLKKKIPKNPKNKKFNNGEADGTRTRNIQIDSLVL